MKRTLVHAGPVLTQHAPALKVRPAPRALVVLLGLMPRLVSALAVQLETWRTTLSVSRSRWSSPPRSPILGERQASRFRAKALVGSVLGLAGAIALAFPGAVSARGESPRDVYIVRLVDPPLASYGGGIRGLSPTTPSALGKVRLNPASARSRAYLAYLGRRQAAGKRAMRATLGRSVEVRFTYKYAYNGFAVTVTKGEARRLARVAGVADVTRAERRRLLTDVSPRWIGATTIWDGSRAPGATKGENVVVGVIDTGVNHDHPSFADVGGDGYNHTNPRGRFFGLCEPVTGKPFCNDKLIGAWDFTGTTPEDDHSHGSLVSSTAVGNAQRATLAARTGISFERQISGMAPHANLISYKACYGVLGCPTESVVAAADQATADGVDTLNLSLGSGPSDPWSDPLSLAVLGAREAGIFVAAAAGNEGPGPETVGSPADSPWLMAVGASTTNRDFANALINLSGGGSTPPSDLAGKGLTKGYGPARVVYAADYGDADCSEPFGAGTFSGQIVVCDFRGFFADWRGQANNVRGGGAGGFVLANTEGDGERTMGTAHSLPFVHLGYSSAERLKAWLAAGGGHTATIAGARIDEADPDADRIVFFSSRGPNKFVPDVAKPDIAAPGWAIFAARHTDPRNLQAPEYGLSQGTSLASPHIAAAGALLRAVHRDWSPAEIQSAMMSTAKTGGLRQDGVGGPVGPFDVGAGRIDLTAAGRAGLVLDETGAGYRAANPSAGGNPASINSPGVTNGDCAVTCAWTRTVRSTLGERATWSTKIAAPSGVDLSVKPSRFTLAPGASQTLTVTAGASAAPMHEWLFGGLSLSTRGAPEAHLPVALKRDKREGQPVDIAATSTSGSRTVSLRTPIAIKDLQTRVFGLGRSRLERGQMIQDPTPLEKYDSDVGTFLTSVDVPTGTRLLSAEIKETTATDADLFIGRDADGDRAPDANEEVCPAATSAALESCTLNDPAGGTYWVMAQDFLTGRGLDDVTLAISTVPEDDNGYLTVSGPKSAPKNSTFDVKLDWNVPTLGSDDKWLGVVELGSGREHPDDIGTLFVTLRRRE